MYIIYIKINILTDIFIFLVVYISTELTCAITVLDGMIYVEAEVEWHLRILKLTKRMLEVGKKCKH